MLLPRALRLAASILAATALCAALPGCAPEAQTETEPEAIARAYLIAVAQGDMAAVSAPAGGRTVANRYPDIRLAFFGTRRPLWIGALTVTHRAAGGVTIEPPLTYMFKIESVIADKGDISVPRGDDAPTLMLVFRDGRWLIVGVSPAGPYPKLL